MNAPTLTFATGQQTQADSTFDASIRFSDDDGPQMDGALPSGWWIVPMMGVGAAFWIGIGILILGCPRRLPCGPCPEEGRDDRHHPRHSLPAHACRGGAPD